jgi:hypothetical protein
MTEYALCGFGDTPYALLVQALQDGRTLGTASLWPSAFASPQLTSEALFSVLLVPQEAPRLDIICGTKHCVDGGIARG